VEGGPRGGRGDAFVRAMYGGRWPLEGDGATPLDRLLAGLPALGDVPLVVDGRGAWHSLNTLHAAAPGGLLYGLRATSDTPAEALLPTALQWPVLQALLPDAWRDTADLELDRRRQRTLDSFPTPPPMPAALLIQQVTGPGWQATVGLRHPAQDPAAGELLLCRQNRVIQRLPGRPLVGVVEVPEMWLTWEGERVARPTQETEILNEVEGLLYPLLTEAAASGPPLTPAQAASLAQHRATLGPLLGASSLPAEAPAPPTAAAPPATPAPIALAERLRTGLRGLEADVEVDRLRVEAGDGRQPLTQRPDGLVLDAHHPLVALACEATDPVWEAFVAALALGALNRALEPMTDEHEQQGVLRLVARL